MRSEITPETIYGCIGSWKVQNINIIKVCLEHKSASFIAQEMEI